MKEIPLTQGKVALVDDEDYAYLSQFKWTSDREYAVRTLPTKQGRHKVYMHREIMNAPEGDEVDHINGRKSDNRHSNLRLCNRSENQSNGFKYSNNTSGYKGVTWHKQRKKWKAALMLHKKHIHIGLFDNVVDAAKAYDKKAQELFGEFAKPNFPLEGTCLREV